MGGSNSTSAAAPPSVAAPPSEAQLLSTLHAALGGAHWRSATNWLQSHEPCDYSAEGRNAWHGVHCHAGKVEAINLSDNDLTGWLPTELGLLTNLQELRLSTGSISGTLPAELAQLSNLRVLAVDSNLISGTIPSEFSKMSQLTTLDLDDNMLSGTLPAFLGQLEKLKRVELHSNSLSGTIPDKFTSASHLMAFDVEDNQISGTIPTELGLLDQLRELRLAHNRLSGSLPTQMAALHIHDLTVDWKQHNDGHRPPWIRRNRGHGGKLKHYATLGTPYNNRSTTLPDDSDEAIAMEGENKQKRAWLAKLSRVRQSDEL